MINKVILLGNVGLDPEVRTLETGVKFARLRLATTERIFNRQTNEASEHTEWHTITMWRGMADVVDKYVKKGSQLYIEGRIRSREWERDGQKHYATEIVADELKLLGRREGGQPAQQGYTPAPSPIAYQQPAAQQPRPAEAPIAQSVAVEPAEAGPDDLPF